MIKRTLTLLFAIILATTAFADNTTGCPLRMLNHWDNLDGTVERGYAGASLWKWEELPDSISPRYDEYFRHNAAIGVNAVVLNNVNASPEILSRDYLEKVAVLANLARVYNIKVYLSVNFASPMVLDGLTTADPLNKEVKRWWKAKVKEIYTLIPDFGGFLVKANSEGQPGPMDFGRTHADGANMLADALKPYHGTVLWRAFVYSPSDADRAKQAYLEFQPLDGQFRENVIIQIKNGPIDFQPREPYSPLFSSMTRTKIAAELQLTQEYLGHSNEIAYLAPMWTEFFSLIDTTKLSAMAGVANIGDQESWCGNTLARANWYAFGRLANDPTLSAETILDDWMMVEFGEVYPALHTIMMESREAVVDYMMPLGLHHLFAWGHHYGPEPWCYIDGAREDWFPKYYHKADAEGLGFNRSSTGSNAVGQYPAELAAIYDNVDTCPLDYLLWFHHVAWDKQLSSGRTLWEELCFRYDRGVKKVRAFQALWEQSRGEVPEPLYSEVQSMLRTQVRDAIWWKDACLLYFQQFSNLPIPATVEQPIHSLDELQAIELGISNFEAPSPALLNSVR